MAFDNETRSRLQKFVTEIRAELTEDFTRQLQQTYGMDPASGEVAPIGNLKHLDDERLETAEILREIMEHYLASEPKKDKAARIAALERIAREQAFTILNRLAALRMMEARGLLLESIGNGTHSQAFQLYQRVANGSLGDTGETYRHFLDSLFDLFASDLPALFDRFGPQSRLFPKQTTLAKALDLINGPEIEPLWGQDETIGWIYQYFNSKEERKAMRDASQAPRNSRELAVRNQFFTPRYVVEFLVDNTLGRLWFNWTGGQTALRERCQYLLVKPDEKPKPLDKLRDPRTIKLLDPACGSMHFGLYAFDLFQEIYREAWDWEQTHGPDALDRETGGSADLKPLSQTYESRESFLHDVPRLIIERNIYGVEIDPRAAQIASLALWLRAQRAWHDTGIKAQDRPQIGRGQVVAAVAPPAELDLRKRFMEELNPLDAELFEQTLFMLKGLPELGVLLQVEKELPALIRKVFGDHGEMFHAEDTTQWQKAEARLREALTSYAREARGTYKGWLFAEDALQGLRMIDHCREVFDVVVMNPPFGEPMEFGKQYCDQHFPGYNKNLLCAFMYRAYALVQNGGAVGVIYDRTAIVKNTYEDFRRQFLIKDGRLASQLDLGWGVLDANVEVTCSSILKEPRRSQEACFVDARLADADKKQLLASSQVSAYRLGHQFEQCKTYTPTVFLTFPNAVLGYDFPEFVVDAFSSRSNIGDTGVQVIAGHTILSDRYFRYWWEVPQDNSFRPDSAWQRLYNGGEYCRFVSHLCDAVYYGASGELIAENKSTILRNLTRQGQGRIGFGKRGDFIDAHVLPEGFISSVEGQAVLVDAQIDPFEVLSFLNGQYFNYVINLYCGQHKYPGYVHLVPSPQWGSANMAAAGNFAASAYRLKESFETADETSPLFFLKDTVQFWMPEFTGKQRAARETIAELERRINAEICRAYALTDEARDFVAERMKSEPSTGGVLDADGEKFWAINLFHFLLGCIFGRWDVRAIRNEVNVERTDPFGRLPAMPPASLASHELGAVENYPFAVARNGIVVDEPGHAEDFSGFLSEFIDFIYEGAGEDIERIFCSIAGRSSFKEYLAHPNGFFADHLSKYSKGRRLAPIYWPLSSTSGSYTLWLYYPSLTSQTLFTAVNDFVEPKLRQVGREAAALREKGSARSREDEKDLEALQALEQELIELRDALLEIAPTYRPNQNDGVQVTAAPLWRLFRHKPWQKVLKDTWEKLEKGDYDWAHLAMTYWPDRVREKCRTDKSLAIAHELEDLYEEPEVNASTSRGRKKAGSAA